MGKTKLPAKSSQIQRAPTRTAQIAPPRPAPIMRRLQPAPDSQIQRVGCACGGEIGADGKCPACRERRDIQRKMTVNALGDMYEQEADQVARAQSQAVIQRQPTTGSTGEGAVATGPVENTNTPRSVSFYKLLPAEREQWQGLIKQDTARLKEISRTSMSILVLANDIVSTFEKWENLDEQNNFGGSLLQKFVLETETPYREEGIFVDTWTTPLDEFKRQLPDDQKSALYRILKKSKLDAATMPPAEQPSFFGTLWEDVKAGHTRDQIFAYFKGMGEAAVGVVEGLATLVTDPGKVAEAIGNLPETVKTLWQNKGKLWDQFLSASPEEQSRMIGRLFGEVEILIATAGAGGGGRAAAAAPELAAAEAFVSASGEAALRAGQIGTQGLAQLGDEGLRMAMLTAQAASAGKEGQKKAKELTEEAENAKQKAKETKGSQRKTDPYETSLKEPPEMRAEAQKLAEKIAKKSLPEGTEVRPKRIERTEAGRAQSGAVTPPESRVAMEYEFSIRFKNGLRVDVDGIEYLIGGNRYFFLEHKEVMTIWEQSHYARESAIAEIDEMLARHSEAYLLAKEKGCLGFKYSTSSEELANLLADRISRLPPRLRQGLLAPSLP